MKSEKINPAEGVYFWDDADAFVEYGLRNNQTIIGHALVWHSQLAPWFPVDSTGAYVTPEVLKERMKNHIATTVGRYKGKIHGWDVVNEAILDDGSYRSTPFYDILGEEYIPLPSAMRTRPTPTQSSTSTTSRWPARPSANDTSR